jgi:hypothetical protein
MQENKQKANQNTKKLTTKQEIYCQEYVSNGQDRSAAYRKAYKTAGSPSTVRAAACDLHQLPTVALRISELMEIQKRAFESDYMTRQIEMVNRFEDIIEEVKKKTKRVKSMEMLEEGVDMFGNPLYRERETISYEPDIDWKLVADIQEKIAKIKGLMRQESNTNVEVAINNDTKFIWESDDD